MKKLIFIVEDEESIRELYECALSDNFDVKTFENAQLFFESLNYSMPNLIILDLMLPDVDGSKILDNLKGDNKFKDIPVIMVSAKGDEVSKVKNLNKGAEDYITKPFGIMELIARINANLRRQEKNKIIIDNVELNEDIYSIIIEKVPYPVTVKEFDLIKYLMENFGKVCKREDILNCVWDIEFDCESRTLDMYIKNLREKLIDSCLEIKTVRGVGYMLIKKDNL